MKLKSSLAAFLSTSVLAGTLALTSSSGLAQNCFFSKLKGTSDPAISNNPANPTFQQQSFNKMGIAGAGVATLAGLFVGGMVIKARAKHSTKSVATEVPQTDIPPTTSFEPSSFAIVVPQAALTHPSIEDAASESESTSVR